MENEIKGQEIRAIEKARGFSANQLKVFAIVAMTVDHQKNLTAQFFGKENWEKPYQLKLR